MSSYYTGVLFLQDKNCYGITRGANSSSLYLFRSFDGSQMGLVPTKIHTRTRRNQFCTVKRMQINRINNDSRIAFIIHIHHGDVDDPKAFTKAMIQYHNLSSKKTYYKKMPYSVHHFAKNDNTEVYTIDPLGCEDIDDGISFGKDALGIHITYIGHHMSKYLNTIQNACTIYPFIHDNIHMLPDKYAKEDFSLIQGEYRNVISLYLYYEGTYEWKVEQVKIKKNLSYEQGDRKFQKILKRQHEFVDSVLPRKTKEVSYNMKYLIEKCAVIYNYYGIRRLLEENYEPIVRESKKKDGFRYACYNYCKKGEKHIHEDMGFSNYGHMTSPIRRIVDIYNQCKMIELLTNKRIQSNIPQLSLDSVNMGIISAKRISTACEMYSWYSKPDLPQSVNGKIINILDNTFYVELELQGKKLRRYIPTVAYYLEIGWIYDPVKCVYRHYNGTERKIQKEENLIFRLIRDSNPYPRVMPVIDFLLYNPEIRDKENGENLQAISMIEDINLPYLP